VYVSVKLLVFSMMNTLHNMHYHTQTSHGNSMQYASQIMWAQPVAGIGQGNGAGPAICTAVSLPFFKIMKEDGFLALITCSMGLSQKAIGGFAFVDDADLCISGQPTTWLTARQGISGQSGRSVQITGGALVPDNVFELD